MVANVLIIGLDDIEAIQLQIRGSYHCEGGLLSIEIIEMIL